MREIEILRGERHHDVARGSPPHAALGVVRRRARRIGARRQSRARAAGKRGIPSKGVFALSAGDRVHAGHRAAPDMAIRWSAIRRRSRRNASTERSPMTAAREEYGVVCCDGTDVEVDADAGAAARSCARAAEQ